MQTNIYYIFGLKPNRDGGVERVGSELVLVNEGRSNGLCLTTYVHRKSSNAYLLTGSLMATKKS